MLRNLTAIPALLAGTMLLGFSGGAVAQDRDAWLQAAQLGEFAPAEQDWAAIEAAAREEGEVVIYSVSSRIFALADEFKERYGVTITAHDITSIEQLEKLRREHEAGIYSVDVLFGNESPSLLAEFLPEGMVWNFVPDDARSQLSAEEMEPFLVQRWSSRVMIYNTQASPDGAPIGNLWDLTRPEWRGRFQIPEASSGVQALVFQTMLQHADEMEAAYVSAFGEPITYSDRVIQATANLPDYGEPNAAIEWLYRILQNDPVYVNSTNSLFENVATVNQADPPMGMVTFSKLRDVAEGSFEAGAGYDIEPAFGVAYPTVLVIADRAPHPNAAKLLIREMIADGFAPWDVLGDYAARADVEARQVEEHGMPPFEEVNLWLVDPDYVYDTSYSYLQLFLALN